MANTKKLKILFVTSEVVPFIKTGGLADVSSALPQKLQELGHQVRIVVPKYGAIDERKYKIHEVVRLKDLTTQIGEKEVTFSLRSSFLTGKKTRVQIYFLDNEDYFGSRHSLYSDPLTDEDFEDNDERFILLNRAVFELINKLGWVPDIIHCNDWQCGLIPACLKLEHSDDEVLSEVKTVFTIHNLAYQGVFPESSIEKTGLADKKAKDKMMNDGKFNFMKTALSYADTITTVSETYADEISSDKDFSLGLHDILSKRSDDIYGIINGIDDTIWHPQKDKKIAKKYSIDTLEYKEDNKKALADKFGFDVKEGKPVVGIISRLYDTKGFDLIKEGFPELMKRNIQLVLLGAGDKEYHRFFEQAFGEYADNFACYIGFDDELAHLIEAGADIFLMPSRFEPCGLNQMYSLAYGTVPVARKTGGLADTVIDFNTEDNSGTGFLFEEYSVDSMLEALDRALSVYSDDKKVWEKIIKAGMKSNFTWINSAKQYIELYKKTLKG